MKQEDKELIVKDLLPRLFHCVKVNVSGDWYSDERQPYDTTICLENCKLLRDFLCEENLVIKPYLRLMSSMGEDENKEFRKTLAKTVIPFDESVSNGIEEWICSFTLETYEYLNSIGVDYRGLISKGLALKQK